ncbi:DoxX-like family protein [Micromonospora echinaurantiaca]|uniref:DoxX-like family protein n=1 Tax=Micromonospora echinaurantiaca TaxID=47857 RepID=A0A1C5I5R7_9ACTN|nr:DoxX family protein [Micromonospora echinaurantiaca]SCG53638.1 DoxX-like family protein [Micromonospora echinaurantiaca]
MSALPDPVWPVILLAVISFGDGLLCLRPVSFIARCLEDVHWPRRYWWVLAPVKFAAAAGLIAGIWVPYLGLITSAALVLYFIVAIALHIRARDLGRNLFVNATGMLIVCVFTLVASF